MRSWLKRYCCYVRVVSSVTVTQSDYQNRLWVKYPGWGKADHMNPSQFPAAGSLYLLEVLPQVFEPTLPELEFQKKSRRARRYQIVIALMRQAPDNWHRFQGKLWCLQTRSFCQSRLLETSMFHLLTEDKPLW